PSTSPPQGDASGQSHQLVHDREPGRLWVDRFPGWGYGSEEAQSERQQEQGEVHEPITGAAPGSSRVVRRPGVGDVFHGTHSGPGFPSGPPSTGNRLPKTGSVLLRSESGAKYGSSRRRGITEWTMCPTEWLVQDRSYASCRPGPWHLPFLRRCQWRHRSPLVSASLRYFPELVQPPGRAVTAGPPWARVVGQSRARGGGRCPGALDGIPPPSSRALSRWSG